MSNNITRIFEFPYRQLQKNNLPDALVTKYNGEWVKTSTQEYIDTANTLSRALIRLGVQANEKIAIISTNNRTEWNFFDIGILQIGAQTVPIYPTITAEDYQYILSHSEATYCIVSDNEVYKKLVSVKNQLPQLKDIYSFESIEGCLNWKELLKLGEDKSNQDEVEARKDNVKSTDLATIIYTSGTTGTPKGVMLSHQNIVSNVIDCSPRIPFKEGEYKALSFLPVCHIFERMVQYIYQYYSVGIYFAESIDKLTDNLQEVKPNIITVVPRLLEKVYDKIILKGNELTGIKKAMFFWALGVGLKYEPYGANGAWYEFKLNIARKLVFKKWQAALGGNIRLMVSGSAALQQRLIRVFCAADIPVVEGYGLTETSPVIAVNDFRNNMFKIGTVGKVVRNLDVKIAEDGEILCKGPNVMMGYYKDPELTKTVINEDHYFHTGDIGEIDADGFLKITDRKKEMFKTSGGKYVAPQIIENTIKQSLFIEQLMVIGEGQKMPAAIVQPNFDFVREWAERKGISEITNADLAKNPKVKQRIEEEIEHYNKRFGKWEQVKKIELVSDIWGIDTGELTPTLKLKRKVIQAKYKELIEKIYA